MSADGKLGPKKLHRAEVAVGRPLLMAFAVHPLVECVTTDDEHWSWDPKTGAVGQIPPAMVIHWSSCPVSPEFHVTEAVNKQIAGFRLIGMGD